MLKDYADQLYKNYNDPSTRDLHSDAINFLAKYHFFTSYSAARKFSKNYVTGSFIKGQNRVDLVQDNKILLFDDLYFVLPYLDKQKFLACLKKKNFEVIK